MDSGRGASKVLLASMPFGSARCPPLGIPLLKAGLAKAGVDCDVKYFFLDFFARFFPIDDPARLRSVERFIQAPRQLHCAGEWLFARHLLLVWQLWR